MSEKIEQLVGNGLIEKSKADYIKEKFQDFTQVIEEWAEKANAIAVTDESQKELMAQAREGRLLLKAKRIEVEKVRKSLKEQSLNEGRMIDSVAKYLTGLIEPAEKHLELQEKFIEIREQEKRIEVKERRLATLAPYWEVIDATAIQLDLITDEAFTTILNGAKMALENKRAEELRLEEERKENERKQEEFSKRSLQIAEYKKYWNPDTDIVLTTETSIIDYNILLQNLINRHAQEVIRQKEIEKENEKLKKQTEKQKEEIKELKTIKKIEQTPTEEPKTIVKIESPFQGEDKILVDAKEYDLLKTRYGIAKTALESVLYFIVPQNLRDLVNKAMQEIAEAGQTNSLE